MIIFEVQISLGSKPNIQFSKHFTTEEIYTAKRMFCTPSISITGYI